MNKVILVGNLTKDPELTTTTSGVEVCRFTIAVQRKFKNSNGEYEADFINCVAWRKTAEFIHQYFAKGKKIGLVGNIQTRNYEAQDGTRRYVTEVVADEVEFVERRSESNAGGKTKTVDKLDPIDDDTLPF